MIETLSSRLQQSEGAPIEIDGRLVLAILQEKITQDRKSLLVRRVSSTKSPVQGLRIKAVKGKIVIDGHSYPDIVLWADTSPASVEITIASKSGCDLKMWNVWRVGDVMHAWLGNAGIHLSKVGKVLTLECSDGVGEANFTDLVVQIEERD
jgi:hypothetical protein